MGVSNPEGWRKSFAVNGVIGFLSGDRRSLESAFSWEQTPEGFEYWRRIADGDEPDTTAALTRVSEMFTEITANQGITVGTIRDATVFMPDLTWQPATPDNLTKAFAT